MKKNLVFSWFKDNLTLCQEYQPLQQHHKFIKYIQDSRKKKDVLVFSKKSSNLMCISKRKNSMTNFKILSYMYVISKVHNTLLCWNQSHRDECRVLVVYTKILVFVIKFLIYNSAIHVFSIKGEFGKPFDNLLMVSRERFALGCNINMRRIISIWIPLRLLHLTKNKIYFLITRRLKTQTWRMA